MVRSSGIREKLRSDVLKELARERSTKRPRIEVPKQADEKDEDEEEEQAKIEQERMLAKARCSTTSLLSILPRPKNTSAFGPTVKLDKLLQMPERADKQTVNGDNKCDDERSNIGASLTEDGVIQVDVSKVVGDISHTLVKELTVERVRPGAVIVPRGKEKQKNQITYLAQLGKATELERKEQAAQSRINKAVARSKYGW